MKVFGIIFALIIMMVAGVAMAAVPDSHDDCQHEGCICLCHIFVSMAPDADIFNIITACSSLADDTFSCISFTSSDIFRPPVC